MIKIPNLFERDWNGDKSRVLPALGKGDVEWVLRSEGTPTVKWDGSACMVRNRELFVRYDLKKDKPPPAGFEPCQGKDLVTGHMPGWIPAEGNKAAKWHLDAFMCTTASDISDGTYEACGPQHQSNPYKFPRNLLIRHGADPISNDLIDACGDFVTNPYDTLKLFLRDAVYKHLDMPAAMSIEGVVWYHKDGRMVKVLASDLGLNWKGKVR